MYLRHAPRLCGTGHSDRVDDRGLAADGTIAREGSLERISAEFAPVVEALRVHVAGTFARLHSAYLYGSIPRGTAVPGVSDLDVLLALHDEPTDADRADARRIEGALDREFPQINGVGIQLASARTLLSDAERHDGGFFVACLCTPLLGDDLAEHLPRYRPTSLLARETNGDLGTLLPGWRERAQTARDHERRTLSRSVARRLVRTGFTLVMPRWGGWTSDLARSAELFGRYYPERLEQMRTAAQTAREPTADPAILAMLIDDLGPWLAAEYTATHGERAPRP
ncbi:nucleotidyltransferase domain-containing protein [Amycolatopsis tucumanensis]|uniref:Nucleotidyltransferase domain-containing protein n=1 Tax=Amycolatopsis tucumanensis TaxID=401106 RepID=A0ABP7HR86_9PSEU